jgi:hypothetical protein
MKKGSGTSQLAPLQSAPVNFYVVGSHLKIILGGLKQKIFLEAVV